MENDDVGAPMGRPGDTGKTKRARLEANGQRGIPRDAEDLSDDDANQIKDAPEPSQSSYPHAPSVRTDDISSYHGMHDEYS